MLCGEGNENGEKTTIGLISKKATLHVQHTFFCTFLCRCFARLRRETSRNFSVTQFLEKNVVRFLVHLFNAADFHLALVAASICHHRYKISNKKKCFLCFFIFCSRSLSSFHSLSFAGLPPTFSLSLSFSCSIFQICGHDN